MDGKDITVRQDETLLQACLREGIEIPYFCYHPSLSLVGQCRMCLVKIEGSAKLATACTTAVAELPAEKKIDGKYDMKVSTTCREVKDARRSMMEFLLANHPLDCPVCDQAGECRLQEYSYDHGSPSSEFVFEKIRAPKRVQLGPHIIYDAERCIKCTRCIRFCSEITGTGELTLVEKGVHTVVGTFEGGSLDNPYSVCAADLCPVGALTFREFRFRERVWFLQSADSVCPECSRNCSVRVDSRGGEILRLVPRYNPAVNGHYMCDHGRLISERIREKENGALPSVMESGARRSLGNDELLSALRDHFAGKRYGPGEAAAVLSGRMCLEEMMAFKHLSGWLQGSLAGEVLYCAGEGDDLLVRDEKRPNYEGARRLGIPVSQKGLDIKRTAEGRKFLLIVREDPVGDAPQESREEIAEAIRSVETVVVMDDHLTMTAALAGCYVPLSGWFEMEGTTVNFKGHLQKISRCVSAPAGRRPFYDVVHGLLNAAGKSSPEGYREWFEEVGKEIPVLGLVKAGSVPLKGIPLPGPGDEND